MPQTEDLNWTRFFDKDDISDPLYQMSDSGIAFIRKRIPELRWASPGKIERAWKEFSGTYEASFLSVQDDLVKEFRYWLDFD